jgi:TolA-binding protein
MSEAPSGGRDSRPGGEWLAGGGPERPEGDPDQRQAQPGAVPDGTDTYALYQRGLDLLGRGSAGRYDAAAGSFRQIVAASPSDDYAQFGLGLALARAGNPGAAAEHLALAAAMRPDLPHYTDALRDVRSALRSRSRNEGKDS